MNIIKSFLRNIYINVKYLLDKIILLSFWGCAGLILVYYFLSDTRSINEKYQCNFDVFFTNFKEESEKLYKKELYLNKPYSFYWNDEVKDAHKNLLKEQFLPEKDIREAKNWIELEVKYRKNWEITTKKELDQLQECKKFITNKK